MSLWEPAGIGQCSAILAFTSAIVVVRGRVSEYLFSCCLTMNWIPSSGVSTGVSAGAVESAIVVRAGVVWSFKKRDVEVLSVAQG